MASRWSVPRNFAAVSRVFSICAITVCIAACDDEAQPGGQGQIAPPDPFAGMPAVDTSGVVGTDCTPHGAALVLARFQRSEEFTPASFAASFGDRAREPNINDCQRLPRPGGPHGVYGPLAYLLPYPEVLDTLSEGGVTSGGVLVAAMIVDTTESAPAYPQLRLRGGLNCAYLKRVGNSLVLAILSVGAETECDPNATTGGAPHLTVHVDTVPTADVPTTGRWAEGSVGATVQPYLGFRCPSGWCEAGPPQLVREPRLGGVGDPPQRRVKGWYDRQILAHRDDAGQLVRSGVEGIIVPHENLGTYTDDMYAAGWLPVATIHMSATLLKYDTTFGLKQGENLLEMHLDTVTTTWKGRITSENGAVFNVKITQAHLHQSPVAVARWGWWENDETMWIRCLHGCCQVGGPE